MLFCSMSLNRSPSLPLSVYLSICLSVCPPACLSVCLGNYISLPLSRCLRPLLVYLAVLVYPPSISSSLRLFSCILCTFLCSTHPLPFFLVRELHRHPHLLLQGLNDWERGGSPRFCARSHKPIFHIKIIFHRKIIIVSARQLAPMSAKPLQGALGLGHISSLAHNISSVQAATFCIHDTYTLLPIWMAVAPAAGTKRLPLPSPALPCGVSPHAYQRCSAPTGCTRHTAAGLQETA